ACPARPNAPPHIAPATGAPTNPKRDAPPVGAPPDRRTARCEPSMHQLPGLAPPFAPDTGAPPTQDATLPLQEPRPRCERSPDHQPLPHAADTTNPQSRR